MVLDSPQSYVPTDAVSSTEITQRRMTTSMEQSPSSEAYSFSASQEIPSILWNRFYKSLYAPLLPCPSHSSLFGDSSNALKRTGNAVVVT